MEHLFFDQHGMLAPRANRAFSGLYRILEASSPLATPRPAFKPCCRHHDDIHGSFGARVPADRLAVARHT